LAVTITTGTLATIVTETGGALGVFGDLVTDLLAEWTPTLAGARGGRHAAEQADDTARTPGTAPPYVGVPAAFARVVERSLGER
jgi:hypothetical protein